jgi:hypothetical protein
VKERLPLILSSTAVVIAVLGATPVGHAVVSAVPPFAGHAKTADYATNAGAVNGIKASTRPRVGWLVALGKSGKFPASVGVAGPSGPQGPAGPAGAVGAVGATGPKGDKGSPGLSGLEENDGPIDIIGPGNTNFADASCPSGKQAIGGGGTAFWTYGMAINSSFRETPTTWRVYYINQTASTQNFRALVYCADVAS